MSELSVSCESFTGPITRLFRLLLDYELDIFSVRLEKVVEQVVEAIMDCQAPLAVDDAGAYVVLCSTMLRLKSRRLLPAVEQDQGEAQASANEPDLLDLSGGLPSMHYREVVDILESLAASSALLCPRGAVPSETPPLTSAVLQKVSLFTLVAAFEQALRTRQPAFMEIIPPECALPWAISYLRQTLGAQGKVELSKVFPAACSRLEVVMIFLGLLELIRLGEIALYEESSQCYLESREAGQVA